MGIVMVESVVSNEIINLSSVPHVKVFHTSDIDDATIHFVLDDLIDCYDFTYEPNKPFVIIDENLKHIVHSDTNMFENIAVC